MRAMPCQGKHSSPVLLTLLVDDNLLRWGRLVIDLHGPGRGGW